MKPPVNYEDEEKAWARAKVRTKTGLLTFDEVSGILGYARTFLQEEIERGNLQATGHHRARRILASSVADYIERAEQVKARAR